MEDDLLTDSESWKARSKAIIFADEDVDGICSAAIVGRRYTKCDFIFVNARTLGIKLKATLSEFDQKNLNYELDIFIVDVGINKANIESIENTVTIMVKRGSRVYYFDSHSNKYDGKTLLVNLKRANVNVYNGKIGSAAASIIQKYMGDEHTQKLRLLGALSDREIKLTNKYKNEKQGLRVLQAAVAWGAYKDTSFLERVTRKLIKYPDLDLESDRDIIEFAIKANNHRDNLLRHVFRNASVLTISETPRILAVMVLDRSDFGKARGTIAGRLAGEWGAAILLVTKSVAENDSYAVTIRNSYNHKLDLEILGQLSKTKNSGGSKGAYRLTIKKDNLLRFFAKVQEWSTKLSPPWYPKKYSNLAINNPQDTDQSDQPKETVIAKPKRKSPPIEPVSVESPSEVISDSLTSGNGELPKKIKQAIKKKKEDKQSPIEVPLKQKPEEDVHFVDLSDMDL